VSAPKPIEHDAVCAALRAWAQLRAESGSRNGPDGFREAWRTVDLAISKSCLLDRMLNVGVMPSATPCPVHEGKWSGCHWGWPGAVKVGIRNGERCEEPAEVSPMCQEWYDAGCRCFMHGCGCTTGWNPDVASHGEDFPR
jgi:hypothetical protein